MAERYDAFRAGLRELGYVEEVNIRIEYRYADGFLDRLPALAAELVRLQPQGDRVGARARQSRREQGHQYDPDRHGERCRPCQLRSCAKPVSPGGNVTGLTNFAEDLASKQIDIIRELLPHLARVGAIINVENPLHVPQWRETQDAAAKASLTLVHFDYRIPDDLERAFAHFAHEKVEAVLVPPDVTFAAYRVRIVALAANARLPTIYFNRKSVVAGGLVSYGPNLVENYRRAAVFVDKF